MIAQETKTEKVPADPNAKEPLLFYWKSEVANRTAEKAAIEKKYAELETKYKTDIDALNAENNRLKKINSELETDKNSRISSRDSGSRSADDRITALEKELAETKRQKDQVERDLQAKTFAEKQLQDRIRVLENSIASNRSEKDTISTSANTASPVAKSTDASANPSNADLQRQVNSLTNQRDQLLRDLAATHSYIQSIKGNQAVPSPVTTTSTTSTTSSSSSLTSADNPKSSTAPVAANSDTKLLDSEAKVRSLETKLSEVISERDKLQRELTTEKAKANTTVAPAPNTSSTTTVSTNTETTTSGSTKTATGNVGTTNDATKTATDSDKRIADLQAQVNSLTNQRDQLLRDIAAIYGTNKQVSVYSPANPYTTIENNAAAKEVTPSKTTVITSNVSLEEAQTKAKKLEAELAEMTKQRDKLQKELDTNYNNMYNSKTNPLSNGTTGTSPTTNGSNTTTTVTSTTETTTSGSTKIATTDPTKTKPAKSGTESTVTTNTETTYTTVTEAQTRIKQLEAELGILTKERDQLKRDLNASKADTSLDSKIAEINARIEKIKADKTLTEEQKAAQIKLANAEIEKINQEKKKVESAIGKNEKDIAAKTQSIDEIKKEYESKIDSLNKEISELKEDKETLETDLASSKEQLEEESVKHKEEIERLTLQAQKLEDALEKEIKKGNKSNPTPTTGTQISSKGGKTIVSLGSKVNFKSGSKELTAQGKRTLDKVISVLKKYSSERIQVEGNTDNRPLPETSQFKDNWHLSFERALTVVKYLNKGSLNKTQFAAVGLGEKNPVKPNTSEVNRAANRRVDIVIVPKR